MACIAELQYSGRLMFSSKSANGSICWHKSLNHAPSCPFKCPFLTGCIDQWWSTAIGSGSHVEISQSLPLSLLFMDTERVTAWVAEFEVLRISKSLLLYMYCCGCLTGTTGKQTASVLSVYGRTMMRID